MKNKSNNITANTLRFSKAMKEMYGAGSSNEHIIKQYENIFSTTDLIQALEENAFVKNKKLSEDVFYIGFVLHLLQTKPHPYFVSTLPQPGTEDKKILHLY